MSHKNGLTLACVISLNIIYSLLITRLVQKLLKNKKMNIHSIFFSNDNPTTLIEEKKSSHIL